MERTMFIHAALRCPEDTSSTDLWRMEIYYAVSVYNCIPDMKYGLYAIKILSRSRFDPL